MYSAIFMLNLKTPAKETHWTRDKVDFCCYNPLGITVSSLEWDARLLQIPPPPPEIIWYKLFEKRSLYYGELVRTPERCEVQRV